jgi:hypothetical protein
MGLAELAIALARERFPEATEVRINEIEIDDESAYIAVAVKLPPKYPTIIEIKFTEQRPQDE